jgi:glycine/D-amino acid oxidase-like deaminating enzyme
MNTASNGSSQSIWMATSPVPQYLPLSADRNAEVCVIGGGIAGLTTAYLLAREGMQVALIDAIGIGAGETGRTTAHLFPPDEWYADIEKAFGTDGSQLVAAGFAQAIDTVESIVKTEAIGCGFERLDGYLYTLPGDSGADLDREYQAARRAGAVTEKLARVPGLSFDTGPCIRFGNQAQFHPLKYLSGLAQATVRRGGAIYG